VGEQLRVVQVGAGSWGRSWAGVVTSAPGIELIAIAEPFAEARERVKDELDGWSGPIVPSLDEALAQVDADAVLVVTPPDSHHAVVTSALRAGKHVLVEKPLATTIDDAEDLIVTADTAERTLMVSQNYRFRRPTRTAQKLIADGVLGDLVSLKIYFQRDTRFLFEGDFRYVMRHPLILDMSIHHFDMIRTITGQDVRRIDARSWRIPDSKYVHDPAAAALIELESGVPVVYEGSWGTFEDETSWNGDWDILGTKGRLTWTGGAAGSYVSITGTSSATVNGQSVSMGFTCLAPVAAQQFTIPSSVLLSLPAGSGSLSVGDYTNLSLFTAPGLDLGLLIGSNATSKSPIAYQ